MSETEPETPPAEWAWVKNPETGGTQKIINHPVIVNYWVRRGWVVTDDPSTVPPPPPVDIPPGEEETTWVRLYHPGVGAYHDFPNNPAALAGARAAGWITPPEDEPPDDPEDPEEAPEPRPPTEETPENPVIDDENEE